MTFCTNCGKNLKEGVIQCDACGASITPANPSLSDALTASNSDPDKTQISLSGTGSTTGGPGGRSGFPAAMAVGAQKGRVLGGRYKLEDCIGSGGMGEIYKARRTHIGDTVAVKVLRGDVVEDDKSRQRFYREARAAAMLHHPNAVVIHDFGEDADGTAYIVMELLVGRSLRQVLTQETTINATRAYGIIRQASAALDAGHRNGIVHRDIKPDNIILLDSNDTLDHVKILDFGIAKVLDSKAMDTHSLEQRLTNVGSVIGTPHYMAPEQCQGEEADPRSDIYSLGVVLYELLTGVAPFLAKTPTGVAIKHVTEKPRPLREITPSIPEAVERVVLHALEKDPNARPQTALELAREYENALASDPETVRFTRSGESLRITPSMVSEISGAVPTPTQTSAPVQSQSFETTISPASGSQNFETTISPSSPSQSFETTISPSTGGHQLQQTGEAATEFISRVKVAPETAPSKQAGESATEVIPRAKVTSEPAQGTELLARSEDARIPQVAPVDPARNLEIGKAAPPADKPGKKNKEVKKEKEKKAEKKEDKKIDVPATVRKPGTTTGTTPIFKNPLVIGGAALVPIIALVVIWAVWPRPETQKPLPVTPTPVVIVTPPGMVLLEGGEFSMGRDDTTDIRQQFEKPAHKVTVDSFFIDITEVTNEMYQKFVDQTGHPPPPIWQGNHFPEGANTLPVTDVTWEDANAYAQWVGDGKRLPTEAEWEFAARGTDGRLYPWGSEWLDNISNTKNDQGKMVLVKQFPQGVSKTGLYDMSGNAWEWTSSDFKEYPGGPAYTPPEGYKNFKVIRGGAYDSQPEFATATVRGAYPATREDWIQGATPDYMKTGFRLAKSAPKQ